VVTFKLYSGGLYLPEADLNNPAQARVGFMFQDTARTDSEFQLTTESYPNCAGLFLFFVPSATRNWSSFAASVRNLFAQNQGSQFGWFAESAGNVSIVTIILVSGQGGAPYVSTPFTFQFNNIALAVQASPFSGAAITFDDPSNTFQFLNKNQSALLLSVQPLNGPQQTFMSQSNALVLPMNGGIDPHAGSVNAAFQFDVQALAGFEAGLMYFAPPQQGLLVALSYPVLRAPGGANTALNFSSWLDVLEPLADQRSYFQATDATVGSYFASSLGQAFAFQTVNGSEIQKTSRLVLASRPVTQTAETDRYYLTPAGSFGLSIDSANNSAPTAQLLCGVTGTEFLTAAVSAGSADSLYFQPACPAYHAPASQVEQTDATGDSPVFLTDGGGGVLTSWVQFVTTAGNYVSQPQESPLYAQSGASLKTSNASGLTFYTLDFLPLPTWKSVQTGAVSASASSVSSPLAPMAPYSGIDSTTDLAPYRQMESEALNPTRKNAFTNAQAKSPPPLKSTAAEADQNLTYAMTQQGLLAGLDSAQTWTTTQIAISSGLSSTDPSVTLQITQMGDAIRQAMQQNQIFLVISTLTSSAGQQLFAFDGPDQTINIAGWPFSLSPAGTPATDGTPPILILKFYPGQSISSLVNDINLWSQANTFNVSYTATQAQTYIQTLIQQACESVYGAGNCPDGNPSGKPDTSSLYYNFYQVVNDPQFSGLLALNCNMQLDSLPTAIRAVTGGMTYPNKNGQPVSNIAAFRVHHVGVQINDTDPTNPNPALATSSLFGLVDYEKPTATAPAKSGISIDAFYNFEVEFLRALFTNSELRNFSCKINLTINNLFGTSVTKQVDATKSSARLLSADDGDSNLVVITGSYQAHSTSDDDSSSGQGVYSFIAEGNFVFTFAENPYLDNITLTKLQFSFDQETPSTSSTKLQTSGGETTTISASFGIWGNLVFKEMKVLDIFSFKQLTFSDLGISVQFDLTVFPPPTSPTTSNLSLSFSPGNLRLDLADSPPKEGSNSMLSLLPFKLKSFLYSQHADETVESLKYFALSSVPLDPGITLVNNFNYALAFDLDLGSAGALVGSLAAFKFSFLIGWLTPNTDYPNGGIAFGVQLPQADGKLEIKIEGVLDIVIEQFLLQYQTDEASGVNMLVVALHNSYMEVLGQRLPPTGLVDFILFAPIGNPDRIGWFAAYNNTGGGGDSGQETSALSRSKQRAIAVSDGNGGNGDGGSSVFELLYLGGGQRVGPTPSSPPTTFADFLAYMTGPFWDAAKDNAYGSVYHPDSNWLVLTDFKLLKIIEVGFVFYDVTPFYSLTLNVTNYFNFEITYTKVSDSIGLFYANFSLPDNLRKFQVGAASLTLPSIGVSVYTNGNWKLDVGFPNGDDWSRSFKVEAMAGPVPVTGSGGFYIASLSSATSSIFKGTYASILAFGFAARLGVGKDFTSGPLKAGISVTFFGIIEGAAGYHNAKSTEIFQSPDALSLQGQFGLIGEIYGSVDFVVIKASVNVTLSASIGIQLAFERSTAGSGTILLYVEASVKVSASLKIDLGLFSISISFSFYASFRFSWTLGGSSSTDQLRMSFAARGAIANAAPVVMPLCAGLSSNMPLWFLPEATVIYPASTGTGAAWFACSLGIEYDPNPPASPTYAQFKPFEAVTAQLVTWTLATVNNQSGCSFVVTRDRLDALDQSPDVLVDWIDYPSLLAELALFSAAVTVPDLPPGTTGNATTFPMPPFLALATQGRLNSSGQPDDLNYQFSAKNIVPESYIDEVDAYFNQLFVNQTSGGGQTSLTATDTTLPLIQEIFLDYFTGVIRGAVHSMLQTMQNNDLDQSPVNDLICATVGAGQFATLAGQMSSSFRGGVRLPYTAGLTIPGGPANTSTNAMFALLWQEFPVGTFDKSNQYTIAVSNPDATQTWITSNVNWALTSAWITPYQQVDASAIEQPTAPVQISFTSLGPQSFAFQNPIPWKQPDGSQVNLLPFPSNLQTLQTTGDAVISVLVESRETGSAYLPDGTPLPTTAFAWTTSVQLTVKQVPDGKGGYLPDIYSLAGASQQDQTRIQQILKLPGLQTLISSIQVLYQTSSGSTGLSSDTIDASQVFVLRTNTTTVSAPPPQLLASSRMLAAEPEQTPVGAAIDDYEAFLQIIEQAAVTNAAGYYLRYINSAGKSLPSDLFSGGPAPITLLISYVPDNSQNTQASPAQIQAYYNYIQFQSLDPALLYYAETTDPALQTQYCAVAAGSVGALLTRDDGVMELQPSAELASAAKLSRSRKYSRADAVNALVAAGYTDEAQVRKLMTDSGSAVAQLNGLYSLVTYQVEASAGFIESNLSAPIPPQQDDDVQDTLRSYRVFVPLYNVATANQGVPTEDANRYASIPDPFTVNFYQLDAFGNQMPAAQAFASTNYYFDPIVPLDQWQGVVSTYDFLVNGSPQANSLTVYLTPSAAGFSQNALSSYQTIYNQLTGPGVSLYIESNLALDSSGNMVQVLLTSAQTTAVVDLVSQIIQYVEGNSKTLTPVALSVAITGTGTLPPVFQLAVLLGIQREKALISPTLKDQFDNVTFPSAQNVNSSIASTVGASNESGTASVDIDTFAANFVSAFPAWLLSVGLNGASQPQSSSANLRGSSSTSRSRALLKSTGAPSDGSSSSGTSPQSLFAVQQSLLNITVGIGSAAGPFYLSPKPLDNTLNTAVVPLPSLPSQLAPASWPASMSFTDVDLDVLNSSFFAAVDSFLQPASAAKAFEVATDAYSTVAYGRESLADQYSTHEVDWLFSPQSPFTGSPTQIDDAQDTFGEQMRAALMTAYSVDTVVQYPVSWITPPPASVQDLLTLYGEVQPKGGGDLPQGYQITTAQVPIESSGASLLTFLFGTSNIQDTASVTLDLEFNVTHVQYFLAPSSETPSDQARPSMWLQLVNPYPNGLPHVGPTGAATEIPLVFRQYPTPPTVMSQSGVQGASSSSVQNLGDNPLVSAAAWHYIYQYQTQLTVHDQLLNSITYNTNLSVSSNGGSGNQALLKDNTNQLYSLFEALARFSATYPILQPYLVNLADTSANWGLAAQSFASLVTEVVTNTTWNPPPTAKLASRLTTITDSYTVTDVPSNGGTQLITLTWDPAQGESSFQGVTLSIEGINPQGVPYPNQYQASVPNGITDTYTPVPPLVNDWIAHQVEVDNLNVLTAENALTGVQVERNLIALESGGAEWYSQDEFIYKTPLVRATQPVTPFVDNSDPINIATLPNQSISAGCSKAPPPSGLPSLCQSIYTLMYDLLADEGSLNSLFEARRTARARSGLVQASDQQESAERRVKVACSYLYPIAAATGGSSGANPISPLLPIVLARSFVIDASQASQLDDFSAQYATAIANWAANNNLVFGSQSQPPGSQLIFDITLYAQLSGVNTPVLRLRNLYLNFTDVSPT